MPSRITLPPGLCICRDLNCKIPYGECHCGCGGSAPIAKNSNKEKGWTKGLPKRYIHGHTGGYKQWVYLPKNLCICRNVECEIPRGFCHCGCGNKTSIAKDSYQVSGLVKGEPRQFIHGHNNQSNLHDRYWNMVDKDGPLLRVELGRCWKWKGHVGKNGYGSIGVQKGHEEVMPVFTSHRASWIVHFGDIPDGLFVLHKCDNRECSNPEHLFLGTQKDNMRDAASKGRIPERGKFNSEQVLEIRKEMKGGKKNWTEVGRKYGVRPKTIKALVRKVTYGSV